jgi:hypothetical protein
MPSVVFVREDHYDVKFPLPYVFETYVVEVFWKVDFSLPWGIIIF